MQLKNIILTSLLIFVTGHSEAMSSIGVENGRLRQCPSTPNCVSSQATDTRHFVEPIHIHATLPEAKNYILKALDKLKVSNRVIVVEDNYIRVEFFSRIFRFIDDVEFYFPNASSNELLIHVRSASRAGYYDFGVNRRRIEMIRREVEKISNYYQTYRGE